MDMESGYKSGGTTSQYTVYKRGFPYLKNKIWTEEGADVLFDHVPSDDDLVLISHMKTGSHWFGYIIYQILTRGRHDDYKEFSTMCPFLGSFLTTLDIAKIEHPRLYRHHMPYNMLNVNKKAKYLYIYRNPSDTLVSAYHFLLQFYDEPFHFDSLFEDFLKGSTYPFGSYFEHVLSYVAHKDDENMFITSYEKIKEDKEREILRIAKFLGDEYYRDITTDQSFLQRVKEHTDFQYMKTHFNYYNGKYKGISFFRKGVVGDGVVTLSLEQRERLDEVGKEYMKGTDLYEEWYS